MTLQTLTGRLQELCHRGHAQDNVVFETVFSGENADSMETMPDGNGNILVRIKMEEKLS